MGYFIQISNDSGRPIFQAAKNYPDVSFASSALFHALVTASLEQGFVPSVLRADDATIGLAVHGSQGSRLGLAMVSSELSTGRTADLEACIRWRLDALYQGALLAAGKDVLRQAASSQGQSDVIRRHLTERLSPVVDQLMAEEEEGTDPEEDANNAPLRSLRGVCAPRLGLRLCGAFLEWLALGSSDIAEMALEDLLAGLSPSSAGQARLGHAPGPAQQPVAVLCWRSRVLAATPAWRNNFSALDRGLLVAMADKVGPAGYRQPQRSLALEEVSDIWPHIGRPTGLQEARRHRMASIRIYPDTDSQQPLSLPRREECSIVLSLLEEVREGETASEGYAQKLHESAARCAKSGGSLETLWRRLLGRTGQGASDSVAEQLLGSEADRLQAAVLLDRGGGDAVTLPTPWHVEMKHGDNKVAALRRLMYWIHALPPLDACNQQQFVCSDSYLVAGVRRDDGIVCWGLSERRPSPEQPAGQPPLPEPALQAVQRLLRRLPRAQGLWSALGALEQPGRLQEPE